MKTQTLLTWILFLTILDQAIKILIYNLFGGIQFEIISSLIEFKPTFNVQHSWVNSLLNDNLGINVGLLPHIILYLLIGILLPTYFSYFRSNIPRNKKLIDVAFVFIMAAVICALRSFGNFLTNLISGLLAYSFLPKKPSIKYDVEPTYGQLALF